MGLVAGNHPSFSKLTATEQDIAVRLSQSSGAEVLPLPTALGRGSIVVAAESAIWPLSKVLIVAATSEHQAWHQHWEEFGSGAASFYYGVPAPPWGGSGRDDPPGGVCVVASSSLVGEEGQRLLARGWDLLLFDGADTHDKTLKQSHPQLRVWLLTHPDDPKLEVGVLSELGQCLYDLDLTKVYDQVPAVVKPGHLLRPSSLAEAKRLAA